MTFSETWPFFRAWIADPLRVAAIAPSGDALARVMTHEITGRSGPVVELGPGTGAFTRALLSRGVKEKDLTLVESCDAFAERLQRRFPAARVLRMDATRLRRAGLFEPASVGAVVSGLPLLSMSPRQVLAVLEAAFGCLRADGALYQFTYGPRCPVPRAILERLDLRASRVGTVLLNVPPAAAYRISRRAARR
ncbi:MAG TPA: methyltransferase domain-containing protein [Ideonella sp.]|nr:methyltransferase domain-containing protein [Ideonella sp.]